MTGTFVTVETGKLSKKGYLKKNPDPQDRRVSRLSIAEKGWVAMRSLFPELQQINDLLFALETRQELATLRRTMQKLVESSQGTLAMINATTGGKNQ